MALNSGSGGGGSGAIRAGRAFVELFTKNSLAAGLNSAAADLKAFGRGISSIGLKFAGLGAIGAGALLPMTNTLRDIAKQGNIADAIGLTAEQFTSISGLAASFGSDSREFIESLVTMGKLGVDASKGIGLAAESFQMMGLNANEFIQLRADQQFFAIFDALGKMKDPLQRTRMLMMAFGEDGGKLLLPLLSKSGDELRRMAKGFAISSDDMRDATKATTAYNAATQTLSKAWQAVSIAAAPIVKILADGLSAAVAPVTEFVKQNREMVVGLSLAVGGVAALGVGMVAVGTAVSALGASWAAFTGIVTTSKAVIAGFGTIIAAPFLAIPAAAAAAWLGFTESGRETVASLGDTIRGIFGETFDNIKAGWKSVVAAISRGDLSGAFAVGLSSIRVEIQRTSNFLEELWTREKQRASSARAVLDAINDSVDYDKAERAAKLAEEQAGAFQGPPTLLASGAMALDLSSVTQAGGRASFLSDASKKALKDREDEALAARLGVYLKGQFADLMGLGSRLSGGFGDFTRLFGGSSPIAAQLNGIALASRGTFGGGANAGFFGGSGGIGEQIKKGIDKTNELLDKQLDKMGNGNLAMPGGGLMFVGGK